MEMARSATTRFITRGSLLFSLAVKEDKWDRRIFSLAGVIAAS
jgi:hypothetical protein